MSEKAAAKEPASGAASEKSGGGSKIVLILTAVNMIATLAIVGVLFISFKKEQTAPKVEDIAAGAEHGEEAGGHGEAPAGEHGAPAAGGHGAPGEKKTTKVPGFGKMVTLDLFTVNLSTPGSAISRFVRVNISVEVPNDEVEGEFGQKMPQVRNTIIDLFNSKRPADLATVEGKETLKEEIKNALNGFLVTGKVKGVFFTNFVVTS